LAARCSGQQSDEDGEDARRGTGLVVALFPVRSASIPASVSYRAPEVNPSTRAGITRRCGATRDL